MGAGFSGTYALPWAQTDLDSVAGADLSALRAGSVWRWSGRATRLDGPQDMLRLNGALGLDRLHARARARLGGPLRSPFDDLDPILSQGFSVTDGRAAYWLSVIDHGSEPLVVCHDGLPPAQTDLWVVKTDLTAPRFTPTQATDASTERAYGVVDTALIDTPDGPRQAGTLAVGDRVMTRDAGAQPILWLGSQSFSEARVMLRPALRPLRAAGIGLQLAPAHLLLISGRGLQDLFNTADVLAPAYALETQWSPSTRLAPVRYIQIVLAQHHILHAEGWGVASSHVADLEHMALSARDRAALHRVCPQAQSYGPYARRVLSRPETALLQAA